MSLPFIKRMTGTFSQFDKQRVMCEDLPVLSELQLDCTDRVCSAMQMEQEEYLMKHPEIIPMLKMCVSKLEQGHKTKQQLGHIARYFTRPSEELDEEIRKFLNVPPEKPYLSDEKKVFKFHHMDLSFDLSKIVKDHLGTTPMQISPFQTERATTESSSFLSLVTSQSTQATPEPEVPPEVTISQIFYTMISNTVNKATMLKVTEQEIKYDTAYVELMKTVEKVMEMAVEHIKEDIIKLLCLAYSKFEDIISEKERVAAAIAWDNRMRKKLKRMIRRQNNFTGYETPPTPKSEISVHPSYKLSPPQICKCQPKWSYNRYPKDRFGLYLPRETNDTMYSVTVIPSEIEEENKEEAV